MFGSYTNNTPQHNTPPNYIYHITTNYIILISKMCWIWNLASPNEFFFFKQIITHSNDQKQNGHIHIKHSKRKIIH